MQLLARQLEQGGALSFSSINASAWPFFAALWHHLEPARSIVVVTSGLKTQESFQQDLITWYSLPAKPSSAATSLRPLFYPDWGILPHESKLPHVDVLSERLETLVALAAQLEKRAAPGSIVVTTVTALLQKTFPPKELAARTRTLQRGDHIDPLDLIEWLEAQGYEPEAQVTQKGEISLRGGILDVWPLISPWPVRLEFFGNDLESLREFEPLNQMSRAEISSVTIPPGGELGILKKWNDESAAATDKPDRTPAILPDYLPADTIYILCEPTLLEEQADRYAQQVPDGNQLSIRWRDFLAKIERPETAILQLEENLELEQLLEPMETAVTPPGHADEVLRFENLDAYRPIGDRAPDQQVAEVQRRAFFAQLHRWLRQGYAVHVFCNNDGERQRFEEIWREYGFVGSDESSAEPKPATHIGSIARGFLFEQARIVVVTDAEIFGRYKVQRPRRLKFAHAQTTRSMLDIDFSELEPGDYVVHLQHGIGRYLGLELMPIAHGRKNRDGSLRPGVEEELAGDTECLAIEFAPTQSDQPAPKLYVPVSEAHLVSKYVGAGKARPPLNTLGGTRWKKTREQAEHAVRDLASELLQIQAVRASQSGHPFPPDTPWQREFESAFLFEETPDQWRAITETKTDMESAKPMDRLICGDVGYGKTEVAIRGAFKAVMGGKQTAILVPTTVLAQQHFNTFRERMSDYPVRIELLSRFRSRREQKKVIENLAAGSIDVVIGTHRLLQDDIQFKELGLVVIDEEQRFGVLHKEKFKRLRTLVDVLTLSATPIPRTLYLALTGARDMSTIETPPQDRLPIETIVAQFDERVIRDAIRREMNRQGQIFFLHNRVTTIEAMAVRLQALVPEARIVVGHGQMDSDELEQAMTRFVNGEADVLLSTTIIESGLDIPNANTIIIDRADRFGLSELYQLRGRVGRYKHQAYAYLLLPRHAGLLVDARKRISAIKQYSSLGSGFKIAMRDLEIRGAGNLLGPQQSGHITAVGFELYCQLLKQSVSSLKGEKVSPRIEVQVRLDFLADVAEADGGLTKSGPKKNATDRVRVSVPRSAATYVDAPAEFEADSSRSVIPPASARLPLDYIPEAGQRIEVYRKLAQATEKAALTQLEKEMRDRFGPLPASVQLLLQVHEIRILAAAKKVSTIETREGKLMLLRNNDWFQLDGKFPRLTKPTAKGRLTEIKKLLLAL